MPERVCSPHTLCARPLPDPILHIVLGTSPLTNVTPPLEHERYAPWVYLSCSMRSWPHPSLQHEKHVQWTCFSCLACSWTPTHPSNTTNTPLWGVFRVCASLAPPHNHPHPLPQLHAGNNDNDEGEGGRAYKVCPQIFFFNSLVPTSPNPHVPPHPLPPIFSPLILPFIFIFSFFF